MTDGIMEAVMFERKKRLQKYNSDLESIDLPNGDWNVCPRPYGRQDKNGECSLKNSCPGYNPGCPQYELPTTK